MKRFATIIALAVVALLSSADAVKAQAPANPYRFGMNVTLIQNGNQKGLSILSVNPGSPAARAGLTPGMIIIESNGMRFNNAQNDYHAVAILQRSVSTGGGVPVTMNMNNRPSTLLTIVRPCGSIVQRKCYPDKNGVPTT